MILVDVSMDSTMIVWRQLFHLKFATLIHAVKVAQIRFVAKMACVVMKILYTMQLPIMPMNAPVFVLITSQVRSNIEIIIPIRK